MLKKAEEIQTGDKVQTENGDWVKVTANRRGMIQGQRMLELDCAMPNWTHVQYGALVEVK